MNKNLYVVILAGGSGTRFWPLSRKILPKQFLELATEGTLLQETCRRVRGLIPSKNILLVTSQLYKTKIVRQLKGCGIPTANILCEPFQRNTAPAIAWAAALIHQRNSKAVMAVLPSDHLIRNPKVFVNVFKSAEALARQKYLVTLGLVPTRPETGYGYLKVSALKGGGRDFRKVDRFTEKPSLSVAKKFLRTKKYLWNSGMFVWETASILAAFAQFQPAIYKYFNGVTRVPNVLKIWDKLPNISIDYGILEKAKNVAVVPASGMGWSDLGSWEALAEVSRKDVHGNVISGDVIAIDCKNTVVRATKRLTAVVGVEGLTIVDTPDALLICPTVLSQRVKEIVDDLKAKGRTALI